MYNPINRTNNEMFFQIIALLVSIILVHTLYVILVRPSAESTMLLHMNMAAAGEVYVPPRSFAIVIKDFEQEACFILMLLVHEFSLNYGLKSFLNGCLRRSKTKVF